MENMTQVFNPRVDALRTDLKERVENQSLNARQYIHNAQDRIDSTQTITSIVIAVAVFVSFYAA